MFTDGSQILDKYDLKKNARRSDRYYHAS